MSKGSATVYRGHSEKESKKVYDEVVAYKEKKGTINVDYLYDDEFKETPTITNVERYIETSVYATENIYVVAIEFDVALTAHSNVSSFSIRGGLQK